jgi:mRNA interferase MazF
MRIATFESTVRCPFRVPYVSEYSFSIPSPTTWMRKSGYRRQHEILRSLFSVILLKTSTPCPMANRFMIKYKVVLVPFPFDDLSSTKVRPAVCLTEPVGPHRHVILAFITSRVPLDPLPSDVMLDIHDPDFAATGLRVSSTLQVHRLMTATTSLIRRELGSLPPEKQAEVNRRLRQLFGLE